MRAAIQTGIRSVESRDIPEPVPDTVSGLIRLRKAGTCGSDLHPYHERAEPQSLPAGHEVRGEVIHLPGGHTGPARIGDLVGDGRFPLEGAPAAFRTAADETTGSVKVHLTVG